MSKIIMLLQCVVLSGCALFSSQKRVSEWVQLDQAKGVSCDSWPLADDEMAIDRLRVIKSGGKVGLLADIKKRTGATQNSFYWFDGDTEVDPEKFKSLIFGQDSFPLSGGFASNAGEVAVINNGTKRGQLEIYNTDSNVVLRTADKLNRAQFDDGYLTNDAKGYWLVLKDSRHQVFFVGDNGKQGEKISAKNLVKFKKQYLNEPTIIPSMDSDFAYAVTLESLTKGDNTTDYFNLSRLKKTGKRSTAEKLDLEAKAGIEAWSAQYSPGGMKLAYVEGDSFIGQSTLHLTKMKLGQTYASVEWNKQILLENIHVSEPLWVNLGQSDAVLMLKWVDAESTLAVHKVGINGVESSQHYGVFPKGSAITGAFSYGDKAEVYVVLRQKLGHRWNFDICKIGEVE